MRTFIRWSVVSILLMFSMSPAFAQDDAVTLKPFSDTAFALTGVMPDGWSSIGNGLYRRAQSAADITLIAQQSAPAAADKVMASLLPQLGLAEAPKSTGTYQSASLNWTLYKVDVKAPTGTVAVDFALAADSESGRTYIVLMQTTADEYDALHKAVFMPVLEALKPLVETVPADLPYTQEEVTFKNGDITLAGTLTIPEGAGPHPALVLVTGSGPQDRDETIGEMKPFRLIADGLTRAGVAVLRYDDRGNGKSTGDFAAATTADFATDATAAINYLLTREDIDSARIGLLGHSEGGAVAAMLGASNHNLAFIISMAGPAVTGKDTLITQNERVYAAEKLSADALKSQLEYLSKLFELVQTKDEKAISQLTYDAVLARLKDLPAEELKKIENPEVYASQQADATAKAMNSDWWRSFLVYNAGDDWAKTTIPALAIFGTLDVQVDANQNAPAFEAAMKKAGNTRYQVTILTGANHLMQAATTGSPTEYATLKQDFMPDFLPTIVKWLAKEGIIEPA